MIKHCTLRSIICARQTPFMAKCLGAGRLSLRAPTHAPPSKSASRRTLSVQSIGDDSAYHGNCTLAK